MESVTNHLSERVRIGFIRAFGLRMGEPAPFSGPVLGELLEKRKKQLPGDEDAFRKACRDMMRIGTYKPTGRGKPASEYLMRAASEGSFPRINTAADINNYLSLKYLVPISLWDTDKQPAQSWLFRAGNAGEAFVFNPSGQTISLEDLVTGYAVDEGQETPIVTPVKDCQQTKTDVETRNVALAIYYPAAWTGAPKLDDILAEGSELLQKVSDRTESGTY
ncbi:MAG: phenylalanine--tRNA ligase beta subunit-related protein [Cyclonatronaceae bacterium]